MRVPVVGAAAISAFGRGWRGLGEALATGAALPGVPAEAPLGNPRVRKMMSRGAYLAASCLGELLPELGWQRTNCGCFLGVGASGGSLDDVTALLAECIVDGQLSLERFGDRGLGACNPLLAFQLMNNFTLCHGAILEGLGGPNAALFSRGAGTTAALIEAVHAIVDRECEHAIAGGADCATHPVTRAELAPLIARGLVPADGAAVLALGGGATDVSPIAFVEGCAIASGHERPLSQAIAEAVPSCAALDLVVIAPWGPSVARELHAWSRTNAASATVVDCSALGDALAAGPALAWVAALDLLRAGRGDRALVVTAGVDGDVGAVVLARGAA